MKPVSLAILAASTTRQAALQAVLPNAQAYNPAQAETVDLLLVDATETLPALPDSSAVLVVLSPTRPDHLPKDASWVASPCRPATLLSHLHRAWMERPRRIGHQSLSVSPPSWHAADGTNLPLSDKEALLLALLMDAPEGCTREEILEHVWHMDAAAVETHALETQLYRLRQKLQPFWPEGWFLGLRNGVCLFLPNEPAT